MAHLQNRWIQLFQCRRIGSLAGDNIQWFWLCRRTCSVWGLVYGILLQAEEFANVWLNCKSAKSRQKSAKLSLEGHFPNRAVESIHLFTPLLHPFSSAHVHFMWGIPSVELLLWLSSCHSCCWLFRMSHGLSWRRLCWRYQRLSITIQRSPTMTFSCRSRKKSRLSSYLRYHRKELTLSHFLLQVCFSFLDLTWTCTPHIARKDIFCCCDRWTIVLVSCVICLFDNSNQEEARRNISHKSAASFPVYRGTPLKVITSEVSMLIVAVTLETKIYESLTLIWPSDEVEHTFWNSFCAPTFPL